MFLPKISLAQEVEFSNTQDLKSFMRELRTKTRALAKIRTEEIKKLDKQYNSRLKEVNAAAVRELESMQKRVASENLDRALAIREAAKSISSPEEKKEEKTPSEQDEKETEVSEQQTSVLVLRETGKSRVYLWALLPDGKAANKNSRTDAKWRLDGNQIFIDFEDGSGWELTPSEDGDYSGERNGKTSSFEHVYGSLDSVTPDAAKSIGSAEKEKTEKIGIPKNAVSWNGHHYLVVDKIKGAGGAIANAEQLGGHLARIESREEHEFIVHLIKGAERGMFLIDGSDKETPGKWLWSDGRAITYFAWDKGEPNNRKGREHSLRMLKRGLMKDDRPSATTGSIIEWDR